MPKKIIHYLMVAASLSGIWYLLSGKADVMHLGLGVLTALVISAIYFPWRQDTYFPMLRFWVYVPWLFIQAVKSNLHVARLVLSPQSKIAPRFVRKSIAGIDDERAQTLLGCSITLTPGTLTVNIEGDSMLVHALDEQMAQDIEQGIIASRVRQVFKDSTI